MKEYRIVSVGNPDAGEWKTAATDGSIAKVELTSPELSQGPPETIYHLNIEARDKQQGSMERFPLTFKFRPGEIEQEQPTIPRE